MQQYNHIKAKTGKVLQLEVIDDSVAIAIKDTKPPIPSHSNPDDFGLTQEDAVAMKVRKLKGDIKNLQNYMDGFETPYSEFAIYQSNKAQEEIDQINRQIKYLKNPANNTKEQIPIETIKAIPITQILADRSMINTSSTTKKCLCPIHNERTPSFSINTEKNLWHCFGCGEGGDIFTLYQKLHKCTFVEALKNLKRYL